MTRRWPSCTLYCRKRFVHVCTGLTKRQYVANYLVIFYCFRMLRLEPSFMGYCNPPIDQSLMYVPVRRFTVHGQSRKHLSFEASGSRAHEINVASRASNDACSWNDSAFTRPYRACGCLSLVTNVSIRDASASRWWSRSQEFTLQE